ncbi:MORN repeat-containing protein [Rugamonas apoptosis]|uniref:MORN repeat protein n=1 Tax=Rugamonas apoptosis TaxID=2758570 RepID=A0A7W2F5L6_9BURK|nr:hypothetical protein [Rugamonas apoptosis]MBA5685536.1 hypothetical protein [Rugamonas apoptosis]
MRKLSAATPRPPLGATVRSHRYRGLTPMLPLALLLAGCGTTYTVDDGSPVDEKLLARIRTYGKGQQALRPSIIKTAELKDKDCSTQYELPFVTASSYDLPKQKKIAWVRGLRVDERLTVIAATRESGLALGDHIEEVDGYSKADTAKMLEELNSLRDNGRPFKLTLAGGRKVPVTPVEVCRGHLNVATPEATEAQSYHWLQSTHPLPLFEQDLTSDEALWMVLWTQGLSEEAGARMKVYHYGMKIVKTSFTIASVVSGVGAIANSANAAAAAAASAQASRAAGQAALEAAAKVAAEEAAASLRAKAQNALLTVARSQAQSVAIDSLKAASVFRDSLSGVSWVAGTGFYMADQWAIDRMAKLGSDPIAAYTLHYKLASKSMAQNAFVFDEERMKWMMAYADKSGNAERVQLAFNGEDPNGPITYAVANTVDPNGLVTYVSDAPLPGTAAAAAAVAATAPTIRVQAGDAVIEGAFVIDANQTTYTGNGKVSWANGDVYVGDLAAGYRTGSGRMEWSNGDRYEGQWRSNLRHGKGTVTWKNGDSWSGVFREDERTEDGTLSRNTITPDLPAAAKDT